MSLKTRTPEAFVSTLAGPVAPTHVVRGYVAATEGYDLEHPNERVSGYVPVVVLTSGEHVNVCRYLPSLDEAEGVLFSFLESVRVLASAYWC